MWRSKGNPTGVATRAHVTAESERSRGWTRRAPRAASDPNNPSAKAAASAFNDRAGFDSLAGREDDARSGAALHDDSRHLLAEAEDDPERLGQMFHCLGQPLHPAFDHPNALLLDMGDQHQCRRCAEGRGPIVGCVASEELTQAWVMKVLGQGAPHGLERSYAEQGTGAVHTDAGGQRHWPGPG